LLYAELHGHEASVEIMSGSFPKRAQTLVLEWLALRRSELMPDWQLAEQRKTLLRIAPLE
jgi:Domain of unknown function (DUF4160)